MSDVSQNLSAMEQNDPAAIEKLLPLVYDDLRRLAAHRMARELPGQTLDATGLVHEAYLRLVADANSRTWNSRGHFFGAAAEAMRRILVERVRHKHSLKAGGGFRREALADVPADAAEAELLEIHELVDTLESLDARKATVVKMKYFAGMTIDECALALGVSAATVENDWAYARCWMRLEIEGNRSKGAAPA
jgi:RNA polymerase sigma factor (TIGR02999 family)